MEDYEETMRRLEEIEIETEARIKRMEKTQEEGLKNTLKHFDRIHDKLFALNTMFIAGFFALVKISSGLSTWIIIIPVANMIYLLWVEWRMMEKSRFESDIMNKTIAEINRWGKSINKTNIISFISILSTMTVAFFFIYYLFLSA